MTEFFKFKCDDPNCYACNNFTPEDFFKQVCVVHGPLVSVERNRVSFGKPIPVHSSEFMAWWDAQPREYPDYFDMVDAACIAWEAGRASAERDIMARWPVGEGKYDIYNMGDYRWLKSKLFPKDEVG